MKRNINITLLLICLINVGLSFAQQKKYNILFIAFDDLKPNLGCYGFSETITPNFDKLAESSTIFTKAYCQQAVCAPTRASLLTGLRPDKTKVWDLQTLIRSKNPDITTLPQYLRLNGYQTIGMGKIFDPRSVDKYLDSVSWSVPYFKKFKLAEGFENLAYQSYQSEAIIAKAKAGVKLAGTGKTNEVKLSTECLDIPDDAYKDGAMTNLAIQQLDKLKSSTSPFFLAVGFNKPHLPFIAPKKYWDLYDRSKISLAQWKHNAVDGPEITYHNSGELRSYFDIVPSAESSKIKRLILDEAKERELIHGYYACISYVDAQVGKLIDALHKNGLDKNTIVVIWGDHGWHLGDHNMWCKHSNLEQATRVPLFLYVPGLTKGKKYEKPVEFVDIYPTICELNGLSIGNYLDGKSLVPALKDNQNTIKEFAISQYPRAGIGTELDREIMGYSLRTNQYRFTEWIGNYFNTAKPFKKEDVKDIELYDLINDPLETKNIANLPSMKKVVKMLSDKLHSYYDQQYKTAGIIANQ